MQFTLGEQVCKLKGGIGSLVHYSSAEQVSKLLGNEGKLALLHLCSLSVQPLKEEHSVVISAKVGETRKELEELQSLVTKHEDIFWEATWSFSFLQNRFVLGLSPSEDL